MKRIIVAAVALLFATPAFAEHTDFEYKVDRFEITGNLPGSVFDEFDDGTLAPWRQLFGTTTEAGGYAILSNPGTHQPMPGYSNIVMDRSDIQSPWAWRVQEGAGDFIGTSTWLPVIPDLPGGFYTMSLDYELTPLLRELVLIGVPNFTPAIQAAGPGGPAGLQFIQLRWVYEYEAGVFGDGSIEESESYLFDPEDLTGDVMLRLAFDDTTNQITASFSMDGGAVFQSPFTPMQSSLPSAGEAVWMLSGDPATLVSTVPAIQPTGLTAVAVLLLTFGLAGIAAKRRRRAL
jgi:hypothetical protein